MRLSFALITLTLASLACRPVMTVGWGELLFVLALLAILVGPPLYRFLRRLEDYRRREREQARRSKKE